MGKLNFFYPVHPNILLFFLIDGGANPTFEVVCVSIRPICLVHKSG